MSEINPRIELSYLHNDTINSIVSFVEQNGEYIPGPKGVEYNRLLKHSQGAFDELSVELSEREDRATLTLIQRGNGKQSEKITIGVVNSQEIILNHHKGKEDITIQVGPDKDSDKIQYGKGATKGSIIYVTNHSKHKVDTYNIDIDSVASELAKINEFNDIVSRANQMTMELSYINVAAHNEM